MIEKAILSLALAPLVISFLVLILPKALGKIITVLSAIGVSGIALYLFITVQGSKSFALPEYFNQIVVIADILLLLYFGFIAIKKKSLLVGVLSLLQIGTFAYLLKIMPVGHEGAQIFVDKLSLFMYLLINIVSGIIAIYSLSYIDKEDCSEFRKRFFMATIWWFIGIMNFIVSVDNIEYFFLLFELTTFASYIFISFRKDKESINNALRALWMNQIGGLAILVAMIAMILNAGYGDISFQTLIAKASSVGVLLPLALLVVAALIKGAQMPFSSWLLGAMVAPTPVSALLHSSTMVKIAPYLILRLAPALHGTPIATVVIILTGFVFLVASIGALAQDNFKKILAHSTIALLGMMIMMAAIGTPIAITAALILILFHGVSKCMLFLNAGVLEKIFHLKNASDMDKLGNIGPFTALITIFGFLSLLLPPFGAFLGKWMSIETLGTSLGTNLIVSKLVYAFVLLFVLVGGAVLSLLYFKVLGIVISRTGTSDKVTFEKTGTIFKGTMVTLMIILVGLILSLPCLLPHFFTPITMATIQSAVPFNLPFPVWTMVIAFILLPLSIFLAKYVRFKKSDLAKEYNCGERHEYQFGTYIFNFEKMNPYYIGIGSALFLALIFISL